MTTKYVCDTCKKDFKQKSNLDNHKKRLKPCVPPVVPVSEPVPNELMTMMRLFSGLLQKGDVSVPVVPPVSVPVVPPVSVPVVPVVNKRHSKYDDELNRLLKAVKSFVEYDNTEIEGTPERRVEVVLDMLRSLLKRHITLEDMGRRMKRPYGALKEISPFLQDSDYYFRRDMFEAYPEM